MYQDDDPQEYLVAELEVALSRVRNGEVTGVVCVLIDEQDEYHAFSATTETCPHAMASLRAAVAYVATRMDMNAVAIIQASKRSQDPTLAS